MLLRLFFPQVERLAGGVKAFQFDAGLGAYDLHKYVAWQTLSGFITEEVVLAHGGRIFCSEYLIFSVEVGRFEIGIEISIHKTCIR